MDMGAGRGACEDAHGWDPGHLSLPGEDAKRTSVTPRNFASPRRCQRLGTGCLEGRDPGTAPRLPPTHPPMRYHPALAVSTGQIKDSSFIWEGVGENAGYQHWECVGPPRPVASPAPVLCVQQPHTPGGVTVPASPEECWTYCQGRIPARFLSLGRYRLEDAIAESLWGCVFLCYLPWCMCARMGAW